MSDETEVTFEMIVDWVEGRLDPAAARAVEAAVESDAGLAADAVWAREFLGRAKPLTLVDVPGELRAALTSRFRAHHAGQQESQSGAVLQEAARRLRRLVAMLTLDSGTQPMAAGMRGAVSSPRQVVYRAETMEVLLAMMPADSHRQSRNAGLSTAGPVGAASSVWSVHGQIFVESGADADASPVAEMPLFGVQLNQDDREVALVYSDELGEFTIAPVEAGVYNLILSGAAIELVVPAIAIGPDPES